MGGYRVGVDIGGTFTDIVFLDSTGQLHTKKISYCNGFHTLGEQALHRPFRFRRFQRPLNFAVSVDPFIYPQAQVSLN